MKPLPFVARSQQLVSLALAALITTAVLASLGAQADGQHADALMAAQAASGQQLCAAAARPARS
jgi:hypothetical protein